MPEPFLHNNGGYRKLRAYQVSEIIFDITYHFVHRFLEKGDRTQDQMIQAARSGKQNIAEGSEASTTSKETEIKLTNVAKASLEELLIDYEDYLRVHGLPMWGKMHPRYERMRLYTQTERFRQGYAVLLPQMNDEELANLCLTLINQTTYMLRRLLESQQKQFLTEGGIREQMTRARLDYRNNHPPTPDHPNQTRPTNPASPASPTTPTPSHQTRPTSPTRPTTPITPTTPTTPTPSLQPRPPRPTSPSTPTDK